MVSVEPLRQATLQMRIILIKDYAMPKQGSTKLVKTSAVKPTVESTVIPPFSKALIDCGVSWQRDTDKQLNTQSIFFKKLNSTKCDLSNISEYRDNFESIALAFCDSKYGDSFSSFVKDDSKTGKAVYILKETASLVEGESTDKKGLQGILRGYVRRSMEAYARYLRGEAREKTKRVKKTYLEAGVKLLHGLTERYGKLEAPTTVEAGFHKLIVAAKDHATSSDNKAKLAFIHANKNS